MAGDDARKEELTRAMARLVEHREQVEKQRDGLQKHASGQLDAVSSQVEVAAKHLERDPNILSFRYAQARLVAAARLRAITARAEGARASKGAEDDTGA